MHTRGSITVFFTLLLSIMISLISTMLLSAKVAAGRVQIVLAVDQALFSAMAKYDRQLFEEYHLFYIDGGFGTGTLQLGKALDELESDMAFLLTPNKEREWTGGQNFLELEKIRSSITGYTLATDCNGSVFMEQAVSYMEETFGMQSISLLAQNLSSQKTVIESQERSREENEKKGTIKDYENIKTEAMERQKNDESSQTESPESETGKGEISEETKKLARETEDVLDAVTTMQRSSVLDLVLQNTQTVSGWAVDQKNMLTNRQLQTGMGYLEVKGEASPIQDMLFQEYVIQNINHYRNELRMTGPSYGIEKILFEKNSDMENLEAMAERLFLIREAVNVAGVCLDQEKMSQVQVFAEALAAIFAAPYLAAVLEGAIVTAWAYAESIVDVRAIFQGEEVPTVKNGTNWQVPFGEIPGALANPDKYYQVSEGMSYEDYLRVFLLFVSEGKKVQGCMEVIEQSMREISGKEQFSMDCAIDALEVSFQIRSQDIITFDITRQKSYRTL